MIDYASAKSVKKRRSARAILFDPSNRVLLIRFRVSQGDGTFTFWATPGGSVEDGEADADAVHREIAEELGLELVFHGPVHTVENRFEHLGELVDNSDVFFIGKCGPELPQLNAPTHEERSAMCEAKWWSVAEIAGTEETVYPPQLADIIRRLIG